MANKYKASPGARFSDSEAEVYGTRITQLADKLGYVTPKIVVEDAKSPKSPLHDYFEWNDKIASEKWRLDQAGYLIRHISITIEDHAKPEIRHFYSITPSEEMKTKDPKVYVTMDVIMSDDEKRKEVILYALRELRGWTERYRQYSELTELIHDIEKHIKKVHA